VIKSWDALDPEGVTDRVLMQQYRETMFYRVALAWRQQRGTPHMAADDAAAARILSAEHIRARFPGLSRDEIEALVEEHRGEGRTLARYADTGVFVRVNMMLDEEAPV
jgi:beta-glucosidase-like glycosyl hydrolase